MKDFDGIEGRWYKCSGNVKDLLGFVWMKDFDARPILILGSRWWIRGGEFVVIRDDRWLPTPSRFWVFSPKPPDYEFSFILPNLRCWNLPLMQECIFAKHVWFVSPISLPPCTIPSSSMLEWMSLWATDLNISNFTICLMIIWAIWEARNNQLWNDILEPSDIISARCISWWLEFNKVSFPVKSNCSTPYLPYWTPSPSGFLKMNVDGAWNDASKKGGVV
ncbi:hypothetical protein ACFX2H_025023 [Malus domestica]